MCFDTKSLDIRGKPCYHMTMINTSYEPKKAILGLTLHQPWADLISEGYKCIENRTWKPPEELIGCYIAIHAGKVYDPLAAFIVQQRFGIQMKCDEEIPLGAIVAVARLEAVLTDSDDPWFYGPYGWVLSDVTPIEPIPCRGARKLWALSEETLQQVRVNFRLACRPELANSPVSQFA